MKEGNIEVRANAHFLSLLVTVQSTVLNSREKDEGEGRDSVVNINISFKIENLCYFS